MRYPAIFTVVGALLSACMAPEFAPRPVGTSYSDLTFDQLLATGRAEYRAARYAEAASLFRRALWQRPASTDALNGLAVVYDRFGRFDLSQPLYERAARADPASEMTRRNLELSRRLSAAAGPLAPVVVERRENAGAGYPDAVAREVPPPSFAPRLTTEPDGQLTLVTRHSPDAGAGRPQAPSRQARLLILNGTGRPGAAARMQSILHKSGWRQTFVATAPRATGRSTIVFPPESRASAEALAKRLGFAVRLRSAGKVTGMVLTLGRNG